ncbi:MAG TPA: flavin reductase family protein [Xanthobacteraceae bacterium]|jgi:flavin reductase (DIM6/NTAB) family NADH-FMN oxidoreductase RutF|nr:flavin reductase family protein [Xanthobacteraceae bacterium]
MEFDPAQLSEPQQYKLMTGTIVPRPIALVTTLGKSGPNAAPFSLFNIVATDPPTLFFSSGNQDDGSEKDTIQNLRHSPEFIVHIVNHEMADRMNICSTNFPPEINELEKAGFTTAPARKVSPPRIVESPACFECRMIRIIDIGSRHHFVLGEVVWFHYRDDVVDERLRVNFQKLNPVGRLSGPMYARLTETFKLERPYL